MKTITRTRAVVLALAITLVAALALPAFAQSAQNANTPSTNVQNEADGDAYFTPTDTSTDGQVTLRFTSTNPYASCFEYRADDHAPDNSRFNFNSDIDGGLYPFTCVNNSSADVTVTAQTDVDVRMVFGAERSERFDWTPVEGFQAAPAPQGPAGPAGNNGNDGNDGAPGSAGPTGPEGPQGPAGPTGTDGADGQGSTGGSDGTAGPAGPAGPQGEQGEPGVTISTDRTNTAPDGNRIGGPSRIETAVLISQHGWPDGAQVAYLADAGNFPDALAAGSLTGGPILLIPSCDGIPTVVADELARLDAEPIALGGITAICDATLTAALAITR